MKNKKQLKVEKINEMSKLALWDRYQLSFDALCFDVLSSVENSVVLKRVKCEDLTWNEA